MLLQPLHALSRRALGANSRWKRMRSGLPWDAAEENIADVAAVAQTRRTLSARSHQHVHHQCSMPKVRMCMCVCARDLAL